MLVGLLLLLSAACSALGDAERQRAATLAAQGQAAAATALAGAPTLLATAQSAAATALAGAPTTIAGSQGAIATLAVQARAAATRVAQAGSGLTDGAADLRGRLAQVQPDANGNVTLTIGEAELTSLLRRDEAAADARVQNLAVTMGDGLIIITGDLTRPVVAPLAAVFQPYVSDGRLMLTVSEITIGTVALPAGVIAYVDARLNNTLNGALQALPGDLLVTNVQVTGGALVISGRLQR